MAISVARLKGEFLQPGLKAKILRILVPLNNGPKEIRALDGLRATAALFVVVFHLFLATSLKNTSIGQATSTIWHYFSSGVELFFALSGFLLFLPYARAMLHDKPLPSVAGFFKRRALRILPAYWVCFVVLAIILAPTQATHLDIGDVISHLTFIHNAFPNYNRDVDGPLWTLAVEAQFYLVLPLLAYLISLVVGKSRSYLRIVLCLLAIAAFAIVMRKVDGMLMAFPSSYNLTGTPFQNFSLIFVLLTYGMQGKFLDIFALGMLASVTYVLVVEDKRLTRGRVVLLGYISLAISLATTLLVTFPFGGHIEVTFIPGWSRGWPDAFYPTSLGIAYASLVLGVVCGSQAVRFLFETRLMRFIGLISYSVYLWHLPIVGGKFWPFSQLPIPVDFVLVFVVAYLSYQLVERPFLKLRLATPQRKPNDQEETASAVAVGQEVMTASSQR